METKLTAWPLRLVIVDGHERARLALVQRLQRIPHVRVLAAVDGVGPALDVIRELTPDAVLLEPKTVDERSPLTVSRLASAGPPVIVITSSLVEGEAKHLIDAGASAVLLKDSDFHRLIQTVRALLDPR